MILCDDVKSSILHKYARYIRYEDGFCVVVRCRWALRYIKDRIKISVLPKTRYHIYTFYSHCSLCVGKHIIVKELFIHCKYFWWNYRLPDTLVHLKSTHTHKRREAKRTKTATAYPCENQYVCSDRQKHLIWDNCV